MPGPGYRDPYGETGGEPAGFEGHVEERASGPGIIGCLLIVLAVALATVALLFFIILFGGGGEGAVQAINCNTNSSEPGGGPDYVSSEPSEEAVADIPGNYYDLYKQAADEYGIDWAILAAVGKIETDHGRLDAPGVQSGVNEYGCCSGPMQFDTAHHNTWAQVGVDGNGDGETDVYDPADAIPSAAKYLVQGGAPDDYQSALYQYNNAQWYVDDVMAQADKYRSADSGSGGGGEEPGTTPALLSPLISPAYAQEDGGSSEGSSEGSGEPPQGWDLVDDSDRTIHYEIADNSFAREFEAAAEEWNALGGVEIAPADGTEEPDVTVIDEPLDGNLGYASSDGTISFDPQVAQGIGAAARKTAAVHELGHALGFDHTTENSVMRETVAAGEETITSPTAYDRRIYKQVWGGPGDSSGDSSGGNGDSSDGSSEGSGDGSGDGSDGSGGGGQDSATTPAPGGADSEFCRNAGGDGGGSGGPGGSGGGEARGSGSGREVYEEATRYDGVDYVLGGPAQCVPGETMDCTCLTLTVFKEFGIDLPDAPQQQRGFGEPVDGEPQVGDLIIYEDPGDGTGGHAGIADGNGGIFHCASEALGCLHSPDYTQAGASPVAEVRRLVDGGDGSGGNGGGGGEESGEGSGG